MPTTGKETSRGSEAGTGGDGTPLLILPPSIHPRRRDEAAGRSAPIGPDGPRRRPWQPDDTRMAEKRTGDPRDEAQHVGGRRFVPVHGVYGTAVIVPGPLTAGPPKPEPEERWTLAPGRHEDAPTEGDAPPDAGPGEPVEPKTSPQPG